MKSKFLTPTLFSALVSAALLLGGAGGAAAGPVGLSADLAVSTAPLATRVDAPPPLRLAERAGSPLAELAPAWSAAADELKQVEVWNRSGKLPVRSGIIRPLAAARRVSLAPGVLTRAGGEHAGGLFARSGEAVVWGASVEVEDAYRVRLHLTDISLPEGTELWVYNDEEVVGPFGRELVSAEGDLWTPSISGGVVRIEARLPTAGATAGFTVAEVAELVRLGDGGEPLTGMSLAPRLGECLIDAQCNGEIDLGVGITDLMQQAIGRIDFVDGGVFTCSGGLLNDLVGATEIPYFLTANHCFANQAAATSVEVFWDYYTASCNGADPGLNGLPRSLGSTLLATGEESDYTLIRLNGIPANRVFLGWNALPAAVPNGTTLYRFSHPFGGPQKYSRNHVDTGFLECIGGPRPEFLYEFFDPGQGDKGGTFGGSSGAPALLPNGQVVGQLTGGCPDGNSDPFDGCDYGNAEVDGAFSTSFEAVGPFLAGTTGEDCVEDGQTLCLQDERFEVTVDWRPKSGADTSVRPANVVPGVSSPDSGLFYYNNANNWEFLIKVLDGCGLNNNYWVFFAATTDVEFTVTVTDTETGDVRTYFNPEGNPADAVTDNRAFANCQ